MRASIPLAVMIALAACTHRSGAVPGAIALDALLGFADPSRCEAAPPLARLLDAMIAGDANTGFRRGKIIAPPRETAAFGTVTLRRHDGVTVIGVPVRGTLFGLSLIAIEQSLPDGGDPGQAHYRFKAEPRTAQRVLAERGFPVELGRSVPIGPPDGYEHFIELIPDPAHAGTTLLTCGYQ